MIQHIESNGINVEIAPPGNHRTNPAERAIQTLKHHMISIFSGVDPDFPMDQWHLLRGVKNQFSTGHNPHPARKQGGGRGAGTPLGARAV